MSLGSSSDVKEQVRTAIDIVDLVGGYVQLRRQGRGYAALCPWHDDSRPSLQVNPERQSWKCWVCDIGGDVFSFVMKMEGVEFREALSMLAERAGISLAKARPAGGPSGAVPAPFDKQTLYRAAAWAEQEYHRCLLESPEAEPARKYLQERGITPASIERFHLGFSPVDRDWILRRAGGEAGRARTLETVGILARPSGGGSPYDRFRGRLLFSIRDVQGRPVGLGGRVLPVEKGDSPHLPERPEGCSAQMGTVPFFHQAKYINSPETPLFTKSHLLYGLDLARDAVRKSRTALVMEGYTDVIVAHQYGFENAVAVLGTALGENHVRILKRFSERIVLVLDGDEAGQKRANEVLELFVAQQVDLDVLTLPDGLDPCDFLHQRGAEAFAELLANRVVNALDHAFQTATRGVDLDRDVHGATQALERLVGILAKAPRLRHDTTREDRLREAKFLQRFSVLFRVDEAEIRRRLTALRRPRQQPSPSRQAESPETVAAWRPGDPLDPAERELLELLLLYPEQWPAACQRIPAEQFAAGVCRQVYETGCRLLAHGVTPAFDQLMLEIDDPAVKSLLVALDEAGRAKGGRTADPAALLEELGKTFNRKEVEKRRPAVNAALREAQLDSTQKEDLLRNIIQQERGRQGISEPTDG